MNGAGPVGHVAVAILEDGSALAVWQRESSSGADLVAQRVTDRGSDGPRFIVGQGNVRGLGYPRLQRFGNSTLVCWSGKDGKEVKTVNCAAGFHNTAGSRRT